ncbi:DUF2020 domain-containing protein [Jatrophihabitans sp. GAS493]|uniref:DUF2020 domain-containing protein n=1 Tax=Jatrophihabitans sp. GAS493 TaxID=1907575 RepID=UPI0012FE04B3|nr:DUF2020 domain-containing protein [Jatrophihabitans sp. GAS493]
MTPEPGPSPTATPVDFVAKPQVPLGDIPPGGTVPSGWIKGDCPYISTEDAAQAEGNHIYLTTVSKSKPTACRFYFYSDPYNAVLEILPTTFATATEAHNAMVLTAKASPVPSSISSYPNFMPGVDLISFQTQMYAPDKGKDWAAVFAKGKTMVLVRTQQNNVSEDARHVARLVVGKF